ncbi:cystatin-A1-like, partial [Boleophthalmus pectinirostris]|uniref:cystatin-A1-like n=1 Tax=Boleophthalmus pectinirostris TaxID=150288 RepID=UPI00242BEAEF
EGSPTCRRKRCRTICDSVKSEVEKLTGENYKIFRALSYKKQLVAGMNYFIEVFIGGDKYLEVDVFVGLPHISTGPVVTGVGRSRKKESEHLNTAPT